jgi:hypothetical protein
MYNRPGDERRRFARIVCSRFACSCTVRPEHSPNECSGPERYGALLLNISPEGLLFETNVRPSIGDILYMEIRPIEGPEVFARIRVLHTRRSPKKVFYLIGAEFEEISGSGKQGLLLLLDTITRVEADLLQK